MTFTSLIDLTRVIENAMPVFPGSKPVVLLQESSLGKQHFNEIRLHISTHTGTHIDCGYHLLESGSDTMTTPIASFYGTGSVVDCRHCSSNGIITRKFLQPYESSIRTSDFVLLNTGWSQFWGRTEYYSMFPVLNEESATYLTSFGLKGIGCDAIGFDPVESESLPVHHIILGSGMILIENLVNLESLPENGFIFSCLPLRIQKGDGSPVRAVGIVSPV